MRQSRQSTEKQRLWHRLLREQPKSGLTVKAFCEQQGVSVPSFYAWRRKMLTQNSRSTGAVDDNLTRLVPVTVVPSAEAVGSARDCARVEIVTPGGFTLRVDRTLAAAEIAELLQVVVACDGGGA